MPRHGGSTKVSKQYRRVAVARNPVPGQTPGRQRERMARQVWHLYPRQDEKPALVHDPHAIARELFLRPADPAIAGHDRLGRGPEQHRPCDPPLHTHLHLQPVALVRPDRTAIPQVMVRCQRRVERAQLFRWNKFQRPIANPLMQRSSSCPPLQPTTRKGLSNLAIAESAGLL